MRAINCPKTADITQDAIAALATDRDLSPDAVSEAAHKDEAVESRLRECDDRYFANDEPIADRLFAWIKANTGKIRVGDA